MTRWARHKEKRAAEEGSTWDQLKTGQSEARSARSTQIKRKSNSPRAQVNAAQKMAIKKNKRSENRRLKRQRRKIDSMVCFHCRMPGHGMADCPRLLADNEHGTGVCFKCGSAEHSSHACTAKLPSNSQFAFAKCFVCGEQGHISKSCPDNPRGLYPNGGCCKLCGSVDHFQRDCPERRIKGEVNAYMLPTCGKVSLDDEVTLYESDDDTKKIILRKPKKVVTF